MFLLGVIKTKSLILLLLVLWCIAGWSLVFKDPSIVLKIILWIYVIVFVPDVKTIKWLFGR